MENVPRINPVISTYKVKKVLILTYVLTPSSVSKNPTVYLICEIHFLYVFNEELGAKALDYYNFFFNLFAECFVDH